MFNHISLMLCMSIEWLFEFSIFFAQVRNLSTVMNVSTQQQIIILFDDTRCATQEISPTSVHTVPMPAFSPARIKLTSIQSTLVSEFYLLFLLWLDLKLAALCQVICAKLKVQSPFQSLYAYHHCHHYPHQFFQFLSGEKNKGTFCYYAYIYKVKCLQENKEQYNVRT
jgi:hypothetical protein